MVANEFDEGWVQGHLLPPNAMELALRVGVVAEADHAQVQFEIFNPSDKVLHAMESMPHIDPRQTYANAVIKLLEAIREMEKATGIDLGAPPHLSVVGSQAEPNEPFPD